MNKGIDLKRVAVVIVLVFVITIVACVFSLSYSPFKPKWEITNKTAKKMEVSNFINNDKIGLQCGQVFIELGQQVTPNDFNIVDEYTIEDKHYYHLLALSKRYECLAQECDGLYYIVALRTTNPGVSDSRGFEIFQTRDDAMKVMKLKNSKIITLEDSNTITKLQFSSDILCELYIAFD